MAVPSGTGTIVDIIVTLILIFSFIGGLRQGAVRESLNLLVLIIGLSLTGILAGTTTSWFIFVWDTTWRHLFSYVVTFLLLMIVLGLLAWPLRAALEKGWSGGAAWSLLGGLIALVSSAIGLVVIVMLFKAYPVFPWLNSSFALSQVLSWLVSTIGAVLSMLPGPLHYV